MNKKWTKTLIKHCNICFQVVKIITNEFEFFLNDISCQIFNIKFNKIVWIFF